MIPKNLRAHSPRVEVVISELFPFRSFVQSSRLLQAGQGKDVYLGFVHEERPTYTVVIYGSRFMINGSRFLDEPSGRAERKVQCYFWRKFKSFWGRLSDMLRHFQLFPKDSFVFFGGVLRSGLHAAVRGSDI